MTSKTPTQKKQPYHVWSVVCRSSAIDRDTNVISLFNVVENINVAKQKIDEAKKQSGKEVIGIPIEFEVVSMWERREDTARTSEVKMEIVDPDDKVLSEHDHKFIFEEGKRRMRNRIRVNGINVTRAGTYQLRLKVRTSKSDRYNIVAELPLEVRMN